MSIRSRLMVILLSGGLGLALSGCDALDGGSDDATGNGETRDNQAFRPDRREATDERIASLSVPDGFRLQVFARGLGHARMLAAAPDGDVYLTCPQQERVLRLRDADGDGSAESVDTVLRDLPGVHGILLHEGGVYLATPTAVWRAARGADGSLGGPQAVIDSLPTGGQHPNRTLGAGPDGRLYVSVGSTCNACEESDSLNATLLRLAFDGSGLGIYARGLRNTIGFGWHPATGELWGMDHGSDGLGGNEPPEELNLLLEGRHYGWPWVFGKRSVDPLMDDPEGTTKEDFARTTEPSTLEYQAHSAPIGMAFYTGTAFPERFRNGAFVAMRGSWNRIPATGYKVVFIPFAEGRPQGFEDFITGFLIEDGRAHFGRLAGLAVAADGSLLFTDDANGVVYRVSWAGG